MEKQWKNIINFYEYFISLSLWRDFSVEAEIPFQRLTVKSRNNAGFAAFVWFLWSVQFKFAKESMEVCAQVKWNWAVAQNCFFSAVQSFLFTVTNPGQMVRSSMMYTGHAIKKSVYV